MRSLKLTPPTPADIHNDFISGEEAVCQLVTDLVDTIQQLQAGSRANASHGGILYDQRSELPCFLEPLSDYLTKCGGLMSFR